MLSSWWMFAALRATRKQVGDTHTHTHTCCTAKPLEQHQQQPARWTERDRRTSQNSAIHVCITILSKRVTSILSTRTPYSAVVVLLNSLAERDGGQGDYNTACSGIQRWVSVDLCISTKKTDFRSLCFLEERVRLSVLGLEEVLLWEDVVTIFFLIYSGNIISEFYEYTSMTWRENIHTLCKQLRVSNTLVVFICLPNKNISC